MAATDLERLVVQIEANTAQASRAIAKFTGDVDKELNKVERRTRAMSDRVTAGFSKAGTAIAGFFTARAVIGFIARISDAADKLQELSNRTGVGTEELQKLAGAAAKANVGTSELNDALDVFARNVGKAMEGEGDLAKLFKQLGITAGDDLISTLLKVANGVKNAETRAEEYRITTIALGRANVELVGFLRQGEEAIRAQADAFKGIISAEANKALADFNQHWEEISVSFTNMAAGPAAFVLGGLSDFIHTLEQGTWPQRLQALASFFSGGIIAQPAVSLEDQIDAVGNALDAATDKVMRMNSALQDAPGFFTAEEIKAAGDEMVRLQKELAALVKQRPPSLAPTAPKPFGGEAGESEADKAKRAAAETRLWVESLDKLSDAFFKTREAERAFVSGQFTDALAARIQTAGDIERLQQDELERARRLKDELVQLARDTADETIRARADTAQAEAELEISRAEGTPQQFEVERAARQQLIDETERLEIEAAESRLARQIEEIDRQQEALDREGEAFAEFQDLRVQLEQAAQDRIDAIRDEASKKRIEREKEEHQTLLQASSDFFGNLATLTQTGNETLQAIGKAAAIAQATIDGILAVQKALASAPPPFNFALAASVGVATAVNVAKIAAMEKGGIVGPGGEMPLRRYRSGGIARGRQFAEFGEGDLPEAFVPLLDGRSIPVTIKTPVLPPPSSSNALTQLFNIDARGAQRGVGEEIKEALAPFWAQYQADKRQMVRQLPDLMVRAEKRKL